MVPMTKRTYEFTVGGKTFRRTTERAQYVFGTFKGGTARFHETREAARRYGAVYKLTEVTKLPTVR